MSMNNSTAQERRERLLNTLQFQPDEMACAAYRDQLDAYITSQLTGQDYMALFSEMALHLDSCLECAAAYARLYELELAAASSNLPHPELIPAPDPAIWRQLAPQPAQALLKRPASESVAERLLEAIQRVGNHVTLRLTSDLLSLLQPPPATAVLRATAGDARYSDHLLTLDPGEQLRQELPLTLNVYRDAQDPQVCLVEVSVKPVGQEWPDLEGIVVILHTPGQRHQASTDAWGLVSFTSISVTHLPELAVELLL